MNKHPADITRSSLAVQIVEADLNRAVHQEAVLMLVDAYSRDSIGAGRPLSAEVRENLIAGLQKHPTTVVFIAYDADSPIGAAVCFLGFATFEARSLMNVHDLIVLTEYRGRQVGRQLLSAVEKKARALGCCKVTLEVFENNHRAIGLYKAAGFNQYQLSDAGGAIFMAKGL